MSIKVARCGILTALAVAVSALERLVPLQAVIPVPGIKLGLANCIVLFVLINLGFWCAASVLFLKCAIASLLFSGLTSFAFSLGGGCLALLGMYLLLKLNGLFSVYGVSVFGAALHNTGQIAVASAVLKSRYVFAYLPVLLLVSVVTGLITGAVSDVLCKRVEVK